MPARFVVHLRGAVVDGHIVVWLVAHGVGGAFLSALGRLGERRIGCFAGAGLGRDFVGGVTGGECADSRCEGPRNRGASGSGQEPRAN